MRSRTFFSVLLAGAIAMGALALVSGGTTSIEAGQCGSCAPVIGPEDCPCVLTGCPKIGGQPFCQYSCPPGGCGALPGPGGGGPGF